MFPWEWIFSSAAGISGAAKRWREGWQIFSFIIIIIIFILFFPSKKTLTCQK